MRGMELAVYEVLGLTYTLLCEKHARERREENMDQCWVQFDEEEYLRYLRARSGFLGPTPPKDFPLPQPCVVGDCFGDADLPRGIGAQTGAGGVQSCGR